MIGMAVATMVISRVERNADNTNAMTIAARRRPVGDTSASAGEAARVVPFSAFREW
jgi:hypothetical protein